MMLNSIPEHVINLIERFNLFLVGGTVRDIVMERKPRDFDLVGKNIEEVLNNLKSKGKIVILDEKEKEYRIVFKDYWIDLSEMKGITIEEDLKKRDFTINSMAIGKSGELIDPFNGKEDIENRLLRTPHTENVIKDPVRILRAFRFMATLDFNIEKNTIFSILDNRSLLKKVAGERIHQELLLILESKNVYKAFESMCRYKVMDIIFPEIEGLRKTSQRYYNEQNLLYHSLLVLKFLEEQLYFSNIFYEPWYILGAFLHDIGKPVTISYDEEGNTHFHGHDKEGARLIENRLKDLRFSGREIEDIKNIISFHMYPHHLAGIENLTSKAVARFLRRTGKYADFLLLFAESDAKASPPREGGLNGYKRLREMINEIRQKSKNKPRRIITGHDLIAMGFEPSPLFRIILEDVQDEFISGNLKTKEDALKYIQDKYRYRNKKEGAYDKNNSDSPAHTGDNGSKTVY